MEIKLKYDLDDINTELKKQVIESVTDAYNVMLRELFTKLGQKLDSFVADLTAALEIKDTRQRERTRKAFANGLAKWSRELLK